MEPTQTPPQAPNNSQPQQPQVVPTPPIVSMPGVQPSPGVPAEISPPPKKSKVGLIIGIIVAVLLVIGIVFAIGIYLIWSSDPIQSKTRSLGFMGEITNGDIDGALAYTDGSAESRKVLESLAPSVKASGIAEKDNAEKDETWYYLYSLDGSTNSMARTTLKKENGKWTVVSLVAGGDNLAVMPAVSLDEETAPSQVASGSCLVATDFDEWYKNGTGIGKTATSYGFDFSDPAKAYSTNVKFEADSLTFTQPEITKLFVEDIADLAKAVEGKQYTVKLYGSVATTTQADLDFATQRAQKVRDDLVALGVPASKISVEQSQNINAISDPAFRNEITKAGARGVYIKFDPTCTSSSDGR